jgi:rubredoxin
LRGAVRRAQGHRRQQIVVQALFKGSAKRTSTPYLCIDCGYIYDGREPFSSLPNSYRCPVCQAPKRRFKVYQKPVSSNNGARPVKQQKPDGRLDEEDAQLFVKFAVGGVVALAVLYAAANALA